MDGPAAVMVAPLGLKVSPTFDQPLMVRCWGLSATAAAVRYCTVLLLLLLPLSAAATAHHCCYCPPLLLLPDMDGQPQG